MVSHLSGPSGYRIWWCYDAGVTRLQIAAAGRSIRRIDRTVAVQAQRCRVSWMWAGIQARRPLPDTPVAALRNRPRPGLVTKTHIRSLTDNGKRGGCPAIGDA